ncbi:MAG: ectoine/hydroxyectoine ABC transporter permease subunit EhuC [Myxococcales bacterium]|jgi:polar amino acid transport system permease protein
MPQLLDLLPSLLKGLQVTLIVTAGGAVVASLAAFAAGLARLSRHLWVRFAALVYIDVFRGTSALVQLFWAYFALPLLGVKLDPMTVGIVVLGLNIGAYGAEVVRGAIQAVPVGQREAAIALNFSGRQTMWRIVLPQAALSMLPPFGNLLIELLKSTALVSLITLSDLTFEAQLLRSATLRSAEIFTLVLIIYFLVALCITYGMRWLERRLAVGRDYGGVR